MLTIEVELLGGRYAASAHNDRNRAEWPPHPARFFSALVAALHENSPVDDNEREALLWLERQPPPSLDVDLDVDENVGRRRVLDVYVPVNDISLIEKALRDREESIRKARAAVVTLAGLPTKPGIDKELKKARRAVENEEKKLAAFLAKQYVVEHDPPETELATAAALLPDRRTRQVRTFPVVFPSRRCFAFGWHEDVSSTLRSALDALCKRVTRLGHSSSLVPFPII